MCSSGRAAPSVSPRNAGKRLPAKPVARRARPRAAIRMDLVRIYECFCDRTRLRILHLLTQSPLCVCHFQTILGEPQVKISKHLGYLRERDLVEVEREQNWMTYSLPQKRAPELGMNLKCLQDCV